MKSNIFSRLIFTSVKSIAQPLALWPDSWESPREEAT